MAHMIEVAKSGRAACRTCKKNIEKGELRFGEEFANQFSTSGEPSYRWHHLACAAQKLPVELDGAMKAYAGDIPNRAELEQTMAGGLAKAATKPAGFPYADHAPTGRARCQQCGEAIEKGALRVAFERELENPRMGATKGAGYLHPPCVAAWAEATGGDVEGIVSDLRGNSRIAAEELEQVVDAVEGMPA